MMIGIFHSAQDSFTGQIRTLMLDVVVTLVPAQSNDSDNAPDWRVLLGDAETGTEIGAGWNRTGERAGAFVAVQIRSEEHTSELQSLMRISYAVFCLHKKNNTYTREHSS